MLVKDYEQLIGKILTKSIRDTKGTLLIRKGTILLKSHTERLAKFKIQIGEVTTIDANAAELNQEVSDHTPKQKPSIRESYEKAKQHFNDMDQFVRQNGIVPIEELEREVLPFIKEIAKRYNLFQLFSELKEQDDYRYRQCIGTAVIATSLGKRLGLEENELALLTTAASLYDIGLVKLPTAIVTKQSRLDTHEYAIIKQHTILGHELLLQSGVEPRVALVALQHHEREDGSGYPSGLKGEGLDRFSKIVGLTDFYMAIISERPYRAALQFFEVIEEIHQQIILNRFDSVIGLTLLDMLLSTQIGCEVVLSDNRRGTILLNNYNYPTRPFIALENHEFIDLSKFEDIKIIEIVG
ncbi:HD-GYP domain-containing protein [Paenibacillus algorifonticola]|uniref:HD-GYP domain-containing protein n=1 Tax=Paenibacillus algorifonticola TaxID=684063 RepID=UPI00069742EB|nr:HD domain-containing phosphohydrolase [Paenibacillus algorifonticola]